MEQAVTFPALMTIRQRRLFVFKTATVIIALFAGLALAELTCRFLLPPQHNLRFQQDVNELNNFGLRQLADIIRNDDNLFWRLAPDQHLPDNGSPFFGVISNSTGLREDHEIPYVKAPGELRILFLGDSCTFGFGVGHRQSFVEQAESILSDYYPENGIECVNAGVPGYSLFQGWKYLETDGLKYQPDVVVVCFGWNDMSMWDHMSDFEHEHHEQSSRAPRALQWSRLAGAFFGVLAGRPEMPLMPRSRLSPEEFAGLLDRVYNLTRELEAHLIVMVWGFRSQTAGNSDMRTEWQLAAYQFATTNSIPMIDLVPLFQTLVREHSADAVFLDQGHATAMTNQVIGGVVADRIRSIVEAGRLTRRTLPK